MKRIRVFQELDPSEALEFLSDLHSAIYQDLESAVESARFYFDLPDTSSPSQGSASAASEGTTLTVVDKAPVPIDPQNRSFDPYLFSMLVRYHLSLGLKARAANGNLDAKVEILANIGIKIVHKGVTIRIWKATDDGSLPPPGDSKSRQNFYQQPLALGYVQGDEENVVGRLAVIWEVNKNLSLQEVTLACPSRSNGAWSAGESHWEIPIPHPAQSIKSNFTGNHDLEIDLLQIATPSAPTAPPPELDVVPLSQKSDKEASAPEPPELDNVVPLNQEDDEEETGSV